MSKLEINLLGDVSVRYNGERVAAFDRSPRLQSLIAYLLLNRNASHPRQRLAFLLWPDSTEPQARNSLRNLLHQLRRTLPDVATYISIDAHTITWRADASFSLDVARFEDTLAEAHAVASPTGRADVLQQAIDLYRGDLLPGCYDDWIGADRDRLRDAFVAALEELAALAERAGDLDSAVQLVHRLLRYDPLRETTYQKLMMLHIEQGDQAQALAVYRQYEAMVAQELAVDPSLQMQELAARARQDHVATPIYMADRPARDGTERLVGRVSEWRALQASWQTASRGPARLIAIQGEAGIGKTRLAQELLHWARGQAIVTASARCYVVEGALPYAPVIEWLRAQPLRDGLAALDDIWLAEVSRLFPDVRALRPNLPEQGPIEDKLQRSRLFEGLARAVSACDRAMILLLDDLQWCDQETLEWLHFLLRFQTDQPLLVIATVRSDDVEGVQKIGPLLGQLERMGILDRIELGTLDATASAQFAAQAADRDISEELAAHLFRETEGNPLFIVETVHFIWEQEVDRRAGLKSQTGHNEDEGAVLPPKIQAVIETRLSRLTPIALELARIAAVCGRSFSLELLASATDLVEEQIVGGMDELWQRRIVRETEPNRYDFNHDKLREVTYSGLSPIQRTHLHRKVGDALAGLYSDDPVRVSGEAAAHFERAGSLDQAVRLHTRAADHAAQLHAYFRAERHYARALVLAHKLNLSHTTMAKIYTQRGRMQELAGDYAGAVATYRDLEELARLRSDRAMELAAVSRLASAYTEPTLVHSRTVSARFFERGISLARALGEHQQEAQLLRTQMVDAFHYGTDDDSRRLGEACIAVARAHDLREDLAYALNDQCICLLLSGRQAVAERYSAEARALFEEQRNLPMLVDSLAQRVWSAYHNVDFDTLPILAEECIVLCQRIGNDWNQSIARHARGQMYTALGDWSSALDDLRTATELGNKAGFAMAPAMIAGFLGAQMRQQGQIDEAQELHLEALRVAEEQVPFMAHAIESQLVMDACALGQVDDALGWLDKAAKRRPVGAVPRAWYVLADLATATVRCAELTGDWPRALAQVDAALEEAERRRLPVYVPGLLVECGRCLLALDRRHEARRRLMAALEIGERHGLRPVQQQVHELLGKL